MKTLSVSFVAAGVSPGCRATDIFVAAGVSPAECQATDTVATTETA